MHIEASQMEHYLLNDTAAIDLQREVDNIGLYRSRKSILLNTRSQIEKLLNNLQLIYIS